MVSHITYFFSMLLLVFMVCHPSQAMITSTNQSQFFVQIIKSLSPNSGSSLSDWDVKGGKPYCNFSGVMCNNEGYVVQINISGRSLSGHFPADICSYLPELRILRLGSNNLRGDFVDSITNCSFLEELSMEHLFLSGTLPDFSPLKNLKILDLSYNCSKASSPCQCLILPILRCSISMRM
ncbi:hypothetical protein M0R45_027109 [Rubus argutus]|uniref:Leucine-rich repeat-containing N-terminal plant-type domain-containing protein n=1 Tax=Rubus argutus TaxID=59490 RepID=A0AAW1X1A2_RUBAR